jgi:two-component system OmpR family response regulator
MTGETILVADDDPHICEIVRFALEKAGFVPHIARDGAEALERFEEVEPDLVVLDVLMPEMDGTDVCRELRRDSDVPVIFLSSKDDEIDRIVGLELGGDDYIGKPFSPRELVARIRAVLRRAAHRGDASSGGGAEDEEMYEDREGALEHGALHLDLDRFEARWGEERVELTATEFGLLRTLMRYPGKVYSRQQLMDGAYEGNVVVSDRTIDSHVRRVRSKFADVDPEARPIETVHGLGYKLTDCEQ